MTRESLAEAGHIASRDLRRDLKASDNVTEDADADDDDQPPGVEKGKLPPIFVDHDEARVNDQVAGHLFALDSLYQRGGQLVRVMQPAKRDIASSPRIEKLPLASLREALTRVVRFWKKDGRSGKWALNHPPDWCVRAIAERGSWPDMPVLRAVVEWPVLTPDGWVIQDPGFDEQTGLLYQPQEVFPEVSAQPTQAEVKTAQAELLDLVCDFPFAGPEHRAAWLAGLLTPFARYAFDGPAPLFLIDKNVRGAGGSLLCDVVSLIATGRMAPKTTQVTDEAEERKRITAIARAGDAFMLIDNISRPFGNGVLDAALTTTIWKERILQESNAPEYPLLTLWWGTGNNVQIRTHADTFRRILPIRLESPYQNPETRTDFKHEDLVGHVKANRPRYVWAALTLLRAFYASKAGPTMKIDSWGSYTDWSNVVRKTIVWLGLDDPYKAHHALTMMSDRTAAGLDMLVMGWKDMLDEQRVKSCTASEAWDWLAEDLELKQRKVISTLRFELLHEALRELSTIEGGRQLPTPLAIGNTLRKYIERPSNGHRIEREDSKTRTGMVKWTVQKIQ